MFERVLIANRGEIAVRVARTLRRLGIQSVAVYSDADAGAPHVAAADLAVRLGPAPAAESYLHVERVVEAARRSGAQAVHPGYGFLSERPAFAQACADAGLVFIGPSPEAMGLLGDKVAAKDAAVAAGVPVVPGLHRPDLSDEEILAWAQDAELPLMLKAAAGGGGKGMRVVREAKDLEEAIGAARREAQAAFGDARLLVERYIDRPRHIEVQVIGDDHGTVLHLGERECSLQRRHQKVIEEAPSPVVDDARRAEMGHAAVRLAKSCGYTNAGTVEFIADDTGAFFFLEMNARLQVEHPVTELVTGVDLVELQLRAAAGEPLGLAQEDVTWTGHAVEARLYAEDPSTGFLPSTGRIVHYRVPDDVRVDSGVATGVEVTSDYDPMLAKVIAYGDDRRTALARLARALGEVEVVGVTTNGPYLRALALQPDVQAGAMDTGMLERLGDLAAADDDPALVAAAFVALLGEARSADPWDARDAWRATGPAWARERLDGPAGEVEVAVRPEGDGRWSFEVGEARGRLLLRAGTLEVDGVARPLGVHHDGGAVWLVDAGRPSRWSITREAARHGGHHGGTLEAPMPGTVIAIRTEEGAEVSEGDVLLVLESMKMELSIVSPGDGVVAGILVGVGDKVSQGQMLVEVGE